MPRCSSCGQANPDIARFCLACGVAFGPRVAREVRKTVTVVFSDLVGSTSLGEHRDPEALREALARYFEEMRTVLEGHGGVVEKFIGDAVMAVFGLPTLHEDDALRAVRAARDMQGALEVLNDELEERWGVRLANRTGVNTGEVVAGESPGGQRLATGDAVNVAARLEQAAGPGQILLGESTYRLVRDAIQAEPVGTLSLKGKAEPVPAFRLLEVLPERRPTDLLRTGPMVGREAEMGSLTRELAAAIESRACRLALVTGGPGVGKSRLVAEFAAEASASANVLTGRCISYGEGIAFWPIRAVVRQAAGILDGDPPELAIARIAALLDGRPESDAVSQRVAAALGLSGAAFPLPETFWALRVFLESLARHHSLVVLLEDLHWAEPTLLDLIDHLLELARDAPLLLLGTARPELDERRPDWTMNKANTVRLALGPLPEVTARCMLEGLIGSSDIDAGIAVRVLEAAEGNPLFVEQIVGMLIDQGQLRRVDGSWVASAGGDELSIPPTIAALVDARLDRLEAEERAVLEGASVIGKVFYPAAIAEILPTRAPALAEALESLTRKEFIKPEPSDFAGGAAFSFHHALIRDAAYRGSLKRTRARLHERFANWLVAAVGDRLQEYEEVLGYHLEQSWRFRVDLGPVDEHGSEVAQLAVRYLGNAGRRAHARGDMPAAAALLQRALDLTQVDDEERAWLLLQVADVCRVQGEFERAQGSLRRAMEIADRIGDRSIAIHAGLTSLNIRLDVDPGVAQEEVEGAARRLAQALEGLGDHKGLAKAWRMIGWTLLIQCRNEAAEQAFKRAAEVARAAGDGEWVRHLALAAESIAIGPTSAPDALRRCRETLEQVGGHPWAEGILLWAVGMLEGYVGLFRDGRRTLERMASLQRELGQWPNHANALMTMGQFEWLRGDLPAAEADLRSALRELEAVRDTSVLAETTAWLGRVLLDEGREEEAEGYTALAERTTAPGNAHAELAWRGTRARMLARQGRTAEGETLARGAVALAEATDNLQFQGDALMDLAEVLEVAGNVPEAEDAVRQAHARYERKGIVSLVERARARLARIGGAAPLRSEAGSGTAP